MKKKRARKKLTPEEKAAQLKKRKELAFRKRIRSSFTDAGFTYFSTLDKHFVIGTRTVELDYLFLYENIIATVYKGNIIKNLIMDCQSYTKYRPNETTGGIFVSWRRKEELPAGLD